MNVDTILSEILPPTFRTSFGWRNEILPSNQQTQIVHSAGTNGIHQNQFNMIHSGFGNVRKNQSNFVQSGFGGVRQNQLNFVHSGLGGIRQNQSNFVQEQKLSEQEIIKRVEQGQIPPVIVRRKLPNNLVTYQQNVSVRYLQPPPLPPPGPLIIREVRPPPPPPLPPIQIKQQAPRPPTPPPIVLRERPPPPPAAMPSKVIRKVLPQVSPGPRRVVIERYGAPPPKPRDVIVERWLPYKKPAERKVLVERAPPLAASKSEPNLLILYDAPQAEIRRKYYHHGVVLADPETYIHRYGAEFDRHMIDPHLIEEATRALPPPPVRIESPPPPPPPPEPAPLPTAPSPIPPPPPVIRPPSPPIIHEDTFRYHASARPSTPPISYITTDRWDEIRELPRSRSYHYDYSRYTTEPPPYHYYSRPRYYENYRRFSDVIPTWDRYCDSYAYRYPSDVIHVRSEHDFHRVMDDLTDGRRPSRVYHSSTYPYYDRYFY